MQVNAIVLAGRANTGVFKGVEPVPWEALIDIHGKPMIQYLLEALENTPEVGKVVVVGPTQYLGWARKAGVELVEQGSCLVENLERGLKTLNPVKGQHILICSSDIPLVDGQILSMFIRRSLKTGALMCYPIVSKDLCESRYPGVKRTYVHLREGVFTGGNVILIDAKVWNRLLDVVGSFFAARKSPIRLARLLGLGIFLRFLFYRLSIRDIESLFFKMFGGSGAAIPFEYPEIGIDVDKVADLQLVRSIVGGRIERNAR